jgi:hypothetical protein
LQEGLVDFTVWQLKELAFTGAGHYSHDLAPELFVCIACINENLLSKDIALDERGSLAQGLLGQGGGCADEVWRWVV